MTACRPGSRRRLRWWAGGEPEADRPRPDDVLRHPLTGSSYRVLAAVDHGDGDLRLHLEGLGLLTAPAGAKIIFYALARGGAYAHRDG